MTKEEYTQTFTDEDAVGWMSIDQELEKLYPGQEPQHYGTVVKYMIGGNDPLDGLSIYESSKHTDYFHIVSYGLSELYYNEESAGGEFSKWGFELTFRVKKVNGEGPSDQAWAMNMMQNLARYVFNSKRWFEEYHALDARGPIRIGYDTDITALAFVTDPELGTIDTPHGQVQFLQIVGLTTDEFKSLTVNKGDKTVEEVITHLKANDPLLITDLGRK